MKNVYVQKKRREITILNVVSLVFLCIFLPGAILGLYINHFICLLSVVGLIAVIPLQVLKASKKRKLRRYYLDMLSDFDL